MFATFFRQMTDSRHVELATSEDGSYWRVVPGGRMVEVGAPNTWTAGDTHIGQGIVALPNGDIAVPFVGYTETHKAYRYLGKPHGAPGLVTWRKNRLSAIVADEVGAFATKPFTIDGAELQLNFVTTYTGSVAVELRDDADTAVEGYTFDVCDYLGGDETGAAVSWGGSTDLGKLIGQKISLHIKLRTAKVFAFEIV